MANYATAVANLAQASREKANMTQERAALHLGIDRTTISRYENGKQDIPVDIIVNMAKVYNDPYLPVSMDPAKAWTLARMYIDAVDKEVMRIIAECVCDGHVSYQEKEKAGPVITKIIKPLVESLTMIVGFFEAP